MELSYKEKMELEITQLKEIVSNVFAVDFSGSSRNRELVDARRVFSKVLRDRGYTFEYIAKSIGRNHATVIHYMKSIESIIAYDKGIRDKYINCKNLFLENKGPLVIESRKKDIDMFVTIIRLNQELQDCVKEKKEILSKFVDYIEEYEKKTGLFPNLYDCRKYILEKFN